MASTLRSYDNCSSATAGDGAHCGRSSTEPENRKSAHTQMIATPTAERAMDTRYPGQGATCKWRAKVPAMIGGVPAIGRVHPRCRPGQRRPRADRHIPT